MVWAAAGNLPEQNKNNKCVNRPPGTAVKKYAGTYDLPCTYKRICLLKPGSGGAYKSASIFGTAIPELSKKGRLVLGEDISILSMQFAGTQDLLQN